MYVSCLTPKLLIDVASLHPSLTSVEARAARQDAQARLEAERAELSELIESTMGGRPIDFRTGKAKLRTESTQVVHCSCAAVL